MKKIFDLVAKQEAITLVAATVGIAGILTGVGLIAANHDPVGLGGLAGGATMLRAAYRRRQHTNNGSDPMPA